MSDKEKVARLYMDDRVLRFIAAQVVLLVVVSFVFGWVFPIFFLVVDFALRAFTFRPAPLAVVARFLSDVLGLKSNMIFAAPKKFAAGVGFVFALVVLVLLVFKYWTAAYVVGGVLIFFAFLESVFKICVGCYVYSGLVAPVVNRFFP